MSLINSMMDNYIIMNKATVSDGEGGFNTEWVEGAEIRCALTLDSTMEARIAQKQGVTSVYTLTVDKDIPIEYGTVIKNKNSGQVYRVTSDPNDKISPSPNINIKQATAERWELTQ